MGGGVDLNGTTWREWESGEVSGKVCGVVGAAGEVAVGRGVR